MSKFWGPLGWMTLHSVSLIYPENPTPSERGIAIKFIDAFAECISCPYCKTHFITMRAIYQNSNPDYLDSRNNFALFVFRAHNTVNARLDKPRQASVSECLQTLKQASAQNSMLAFRTSYINYLTNNWNREVGGDAMIIRSVVKEVKKIIEEYFNPRDTGTFPEIKEADVLTPIENRQLRFISPMNLVSVNVGFRGGKLRLKKR
jgi:hypothetical protein